MKFWIEQSEKDESKSFVGVEQGDAMGFAEVNADAKTLRRMAGVVGGIILSGKLLDRRRLSDRARKEAWKRQRNLYKVQKDPRRSTGMNMKSLLLPRRKKRR